MAVNHKDREINKYKKGGRGARYFKIIGKKNGKQNIAPLQPPTLATFRFWGIQWELVVPARRCKLNSILILRKSFLWKTELNS